MFTRTLPLLVASFLTFGCGAPNDLHAGVGGGASSSSSSSSSNSSAAGSSGDASGSSSANATGAGGSEPTAPRVRIVFPPDGATAEDSIVVRGVVETPGPVSAVQVNGTPATSSDGFHTWRAEVPLSMGANAISAQVDAAQDVVPATVQIERFADDESIHRGSGALWDSYRLFRHTISADGKSILVPDDVSDALINVDLATGDHSFVICTENTPVCEGQSDGPDLTFPLAVGALDHRAFIVDGSLVLEVDLGTHAATVLSDGSHGTGPVPQKLSGIAVDAATSHAILADWEWMGSYYSALLALDLQTGDRTLIADSDVGSGGNLAIGTFGVAFGMQRAIATRPYSATLFAIDLGSGNRSVFSGEGSGTGPAIEAPGEVAVAEPLGMAFVWDGSQQSLFGVDLATGDRHVTAAAMIGRGFALGNVGSLAFGRDLLFAREADLNAFVAIDPLEGTRVVVSK